MLHQLVVLMGDLIGVLFPDPSFADVRRWF